MKFFLPLFFTATLFAACQNSAPSVPAATTTYDASAILSHKYWVSKAFHDALFASTVSDTLANIFCGELIFEGKDTVLMTACLSDAGRGWFKITAPNALSIAFEGDTANLYTANLDEKTGVLHVTPPAGMAEGNGYPTEFVAVSGVDVSNLDNVTYSLGRKRLAGTYAALPQKGAKTTMGPLTLNPDGSQTGLGDFDKYEPYLAGIGSGAVQNPPMNLLYLVKKGQENTPTALGWQLHGDTLSIWDTKNVNAEGDLPEYKPTKLRGAYVKSK